MIRFGRRPHFLDKNYDYNRYFCIGRVNSNIFVQWFRTSSSAFTSALFRKTFASTEALFIFGFKFKYETNLVSSFAKTENPEKKSFRIALCHSEITLIFTTSCKEA